MAGDTGKTTSNPSTYGGTWCCALNPPARSEISAFSTFWIPERDQCLMNEGIPQASNHIGRPSSRKKSYSEVDRAITVVLQHSAD